uniref:DcrB-related protein n=1 Tax=Photorhabdus caribbeanensis TaxID=1004165 RepID=UPI001FEAC25E
MSCSPGLIMRSVNISSCCYLTTPGEFTGTLQPVSINNGKSMENTTYQMNEGSLAIPDNWRDESMNVFVLPDDSGINLVVSRTPVPA